MWKTSTGRGLDSNLKRNREGYANTKGNIEAVVMPVQSYQMTVDPNNLTPENYKISNSSRQLRTLLLLLLLEASRI